MSSLEGQVARLRFLVGRAPDIRLRMHEGLVGASVRYDATEFTATGQDPVSAMRQLVVTVKRYKKGRL